MPDYKEIKTTRLSGGLTLGEILYISLKNVYLSVYVWANSADPIIAWMRHRCWCYYWYLLPVGQFFSVCLCAFNSNGSFDIFIIWLSELTVHSTFFFSKDNTSDFKSLLLRHKASACLLPCLLWAKDKNILLESHLQVAAGWSWLYSIPITRVLWPPP